MACYMLSDQVLLSLLCSPNLLAEKVASRIAENFSDTALIMVDMLFFFLSLIFISWPISLATCFQSYLTTEGAGNCKLSLTLQYVSGEKLKLISQDFNQGFFYFQMSTPVEAIESS